MRDVVAVMSALTLVHEHTLEVVPHVVALLRCRVERKELAHVELERVRDGVVRFRTLQFLRVPYETDEGEVKDLHVEGSFSESEWKRKGRNAYGRKGNENSFPLSVLIARALLACVPTGEKVRTGAC